MDWDPPLGAWQRPYFDTHCLMGSGFAWEYMRRNRGYQDSWSNQKPTWEDEGTERGMRVVRLTQTGDTRLHPCLWSSSPGRSALQADVAWHPLANPSVLRAVALPPKLSFGTGLFDPDAYDLQKTLLVLPDGSQELILRDGHRLLQLHIVGGTLKAGDALFVDLAAAEDSVSQLRAIACFRELGTKGILMNKYFPPHPHAARLARCLQALDGFRAGAEHRAIAVAMYGEARVCDTWSDPNENLRDQVRRAIIRGRALMERGFLDLLRS